MVMSRRFFVFIWPGRFFPLKQDETTEARAYGDLSVFGKWPALILFSKNQRHALSMPLVFTCFY